MNHGAITREKLLWMYRAMRTIRTFEERVAELFAGGEIPGLVHSSVGQEAVAVGVCAALEPGDMVTSTHRGHGHLLARGGGLKPMMAEIFGRRTGYCKGKGGSMHVAHYDLGFFGANGIVGGGIPIATGAALAAQMRGDGRVAVAFFGDGAANEGVFHESLNLAAVWRLPVIYVCENNGIGEFTAIRESTAVTEIAVRAQAYGIPGSSVDGNDVLAVYAATRAAVERTRDGRGPELIEALTSRWGGHVVGEEASTPEYRDAEELRKARRHCPIARLASVLRATGAGVAEDLGGIEEEVRAAVEAAVEAARLGPAPEPEEALRDVFSATPA